MIRSRTTHFLHVITFVATGAATLGAASTAKAFEGGVPCRRAPARWNAAKGAIVTGISDGPINAILGAVGESRTHSMISHGDWATHSTSLTPSTLGSVPAAGMPLNPQELAKGHPGLSQIPMGGAYAYWSGAHQVFTQVIPPRPLIQIFCEGGCKAQKVADWLWNDVPYRQVLGFDAYFSLNPEAHGTYYYELGFNEPNGAFHHLPYGFYQYRMGVDKTHGADIDSPDDRGIVCSQAPAWAYSHWINTPGRAAIVPGTEVIDTHQYTHNETMAAIDALWNSVNQGCLNSSSGFWNTVGSFIFGVNRAAVCSGAAYQVLNCFLMGEELDGSGCASTSTAPRTNYRRNTRTSGANSLSPDTLIGLSGRPRTGNTVGPWADLSEVALQWNNGGSSYGCFW